MTVWFVGLLINAASCGANVSMRNYGFATVSGLCAMFCIAKLSILA